jgi:hypothetical protein
MSGYIKKMGLMVGVSTLALGMFAAAPATAFDDVDWTWTATVTEIVTKDVDIDIVIEPTGMVMLEDLQIQIGDVTATSTVNGIYNNQPEGGDGGGGENGPIIVDLGTLSFTGNYDQPAGNVTGTATAPDLPEEEFLAGTVNNGSPFGITMNFDLGTIEVEVPDDPDGEPGAPLDALTELPEVISTATAVGNNTTIETDAAVQLHEAQVLVGSIEYPTDGEDGGLDQGLDVLGLGVTPATVSATSTVYDILNASVDSSATAVGNNLAVAIEAEGPDRLLIADVIQLSVADVTATSTVYDVSLNNYINLGVLDRPIVSSVATAVGNNKSISVNAPDVDVDTGGGTAP